MSANNKKLLSLYGLKWNPFQPDVPTEALYPRPELGSFLWRVENLVMDGGLAAVMGDSGFGKSVILRMLDDKLKGLRDVTVRRIDRAQSGLSDFYREMGDLFGIQLKVVNRYGGFQALRYKWRQHIESTLLRAVLLIDESQDMPAMALSELRSLISDEFDSKRILTVVLAGDMRLSERLKADELIPLSRRIRCRLTLSPMADNEMMKMLEYALRAAGNPKLITSGCLEALVAHSGGNPATMMLTADELLANAMASEKNQIDKAIFFQAFQIKTPASNSKMPKEQKNR